VLLRPVASSLRPRRQMTSAVTSQRRTSKPRGIDLEPTNARRYRFKIVAGVAPPVGDHRVPIFRWSNTLKKSSGGHLPKIS
jgi:hypothetical protein